MGRYFKSVLPSVAAGTVMAGVVYAVIYGPGPLSESLSPWPSWARLALAIPLGALTYTLALAVVAREHFELAVAEIRRLIKR